MKTLKLIFTIVAVALLFSQCQYDFIVPEEIIDPDDPSAEEVSFSAEIIPIFANNCTACHNTGGQRPDLTAENAYSVLTGTTRYINEDTPEESLIYTRAHPSNTDSHPKYSEAEAALVLTWIKQGAQNN
ncbi:MAG: c-type cytochrome [Bacteroidota bacterium]